MTMTAQPVDTSTIDPYAVPLDQIDVANDELFRTRQHWGFFERLRNEDPGHVQTEGGSVGKGGGGAR